MFTHCIRISSGWSNFTILCSLYKFNSMIDEWYTGNVLEGRRSGLIELLYKNLLEVYKENNKIFRSGQPIFRSRREENTARIQIYSVTTPTCSVTMQSKQYGWHVTIREAGCRVAPMTALVGAVWFVQKCLASKIVVLLVDWTQLLTSAYSSTYNIKVCDNGILT
jgi:hypothetical protein